MGLMTVPSRTFDGIVNLVVRLNGRYARLFDGTGWTTWGIQHLDDHQDEYVQIAADAAILGDSAAGEEVTRKERVDLRRTLRHRHNKVVKLLQAGAVIALLVWREVDQLHRVGVLRVVEEIVTLGVLTGFWVVFWAAMDRARALGVEATCKRLSGAGGFKRDLAVLDWLDAHWSWALPPHCLRFEVAHIEGIHGGRRFLVLSENQVTRLRRHTIQARIRPLLRTCVFLPSKGAKVEKLGVLASSLPMPRIHMFATPGGLFAYWAGATLGTELDAPLGDVLELLIGEGHRAGVLPGLVEGAADRLEGSSSSVERGRNGSTEGRHGNTE